MDESWTIAELAELAAAALAAGDQQGHGPARASGRVRDVPNERLIRWYVTVGLVNPPLSRRGRVAWYGPRHLLQLVAIKRRQAEGRSLAEIQAELAGATNPSLAAVARVPEAVLATGTGAGVAQADRVAQAGRVAPAGRAAPARSRSPGPSRCPGRSRCAGRSRCPGRSRWPGRRRGARRRNRSGRPRGKVCPGRWPHRNRHGHGRRRDQGACPVLGTAARSVRRSPGPAGPQRCCPAGRRRPGQMQASVPPPEATTGPSWRVWSGWHRG